MKIKVLVSVLLLLGLVQNRPEGWEIFSEVVFYPKFFEEAGEELATPQFNEALKELEGKEVELSGFYIPLEMDSSIMLSALPYSSCFFCGGAGPETIAEIQIQPLPRNLSPDEFLKVRGKLKLNDWDLNHMNFILEEAKILK